MWNKLLFCCICLVLFNRAYGQNVTPSLFPEQPNHAAAALVTSNRHAFVQSDVAFTPLFNFPSNEETGGITSLPLLNAFFIGAGGALPFLSNPIFLGPEDADSKFAHYSYFLQLRAQLQRFGLQLYSSYESLNQENQTDSQRLYQTSEQLLSVGYLMMPELSVGLSWQRSTLAGRSYFNVETGQIEKQAYEISAGYHFLDFLHALLSYRFVQQQQNKTVDLNYSEYSYGLSVETPLLLLSWLRFEWTDTYSPEATAKRTDTLFANVHRQTRARSVQLEGQLGNVFLGYHTLESVEAQTTFEDVLYARVNNIEETLHIGYSYLGGMLRSGLKLRTFLFKQGPDEVFFLRSYEINQEVIF